MRTLWVALSLFALAACGSRGCAWRSAKVDAGPTLPPPSLRLVFVTDLKGYLEPCGCTVRPLGGVHRLGGTLARLRGDGAPTAFVVVGDTFLDPAAGADRAEQDTLQAEALRDVLLQLHVDAVVPGRTDRRRGDEWLTSLVAGKAVPMLASGPELPPALGAQPTALLTLGSTRVGLLGATDAFGADPASFAESVRSLRSRGADVVVALVRGDRRFTRSVAGTAGVDFVIEGGLDAEVPEPPSERGNAWVFEGGRQGQRVVVLNLYRRDASRFRDESPWSREVARQRLDRDRSERASQIEVWQREGRPARDLDEQRAALRSLDERLAATQRPPDVRAGNAFAAELIELAAGAPEDARIASLVDALGTRVNERNRVAFADVAPAPVAPGMPTYVGSAACKSCHEASNRWWENHPHGRAYATLTSRHREYNLACVGCHVTGYGRPGGATVTQNLGGLLVNVGCENCHGPGSEHVANPQGAVHDVVRQVPEAVCVQCHNHEHSDHFDYRNYMRMVVVPGHGLPLGGSR